MPLDHYVSQVHLRKFYSPELGPLMYAIRKSDLARFTPNAQSVCRIAAGSTNAYLMEPRAIEEFLKDIEPRYDSALEGLLAPDVDRDAVYVIAGFVAYVLSCSPGGMRIHTEPMAAMLDATAKMLDDRGLLPSPPSELGATNAIELLRSGRVRFEVDPKYPQALGIASILARTLTFANFRWEILLNPFEDTPFFTSDLPVAIEPVGDPTVINRVVPLAPDLAIRISPQLLDSSERLDSSLRRFRYRRRTISRHEAVALNRLIVRCAETTVFFRDDLAWVLPFVKKNARFRIEPCTRRMTHDRGELTITAMTIGTSHASVRS